MFYSTSSLSICKILVRFKFLVQFGLRDSEFQSVGEISSPKTVKKKMEIRNLEFLRAASSQKVGLHLPKWAFSYSVFLSPRVIPSSKKTEFEQFHNFGIM